MRYRIDYRSGDVDLTRSLAKARRLADESRSGAEVFDLQSMRQRGDSALSEEDVAYQSRGRGEPTEWEREEAVFAEEARRERAAREARAAEPGDTRFERTILEDGILLIGYDDEGDEVSRDFFNTEDEVGSFIQGFRSSQESDFAERYAPFGAAWQAEQEAHYRADGAADGVWR